MGNMHEFLVVGGRSLASQMLMLEGSLGKSQRDRDARDYLNESIPRGLFVVSAGKPAANQHSADLRRPKWKMKEQIVEKQPMESL